MLKISDLSVQINDKLVLNNFNLEINDGEIHVIMGKNGIGKSTLCKVLLRDENYQVLGGHITYNNQDLLKMTTDEVARERIALISQTPIAIEGISNAELLRTALRERNNAKINIYEFNKKMEEACAKLKLDPAFIHKEVNVGASGGERKKVELLHVAILEPNFLILDELDSGLDVDALKTVADFINDYYQQTHCSILLITHHTNIINYIKPNYVHVLDEGKIKQTGDYHLAFEIEKKGFNGTNNISDSDQNE